MVVVVVVLHLAVEVTCETRQFATIGLVKMFILAVLH